MKIKFLVTAMALLTIISCNQSPKENNQNSATDSASLKPTAADTTAMANKSAGVYFVNIKDGDQLKSPLIVQMGVTGMEVEPAGKLEEGKGHHHLIVDGSYVEKGLAVPNDATHIHFGKGQTTDTLQLSPGAHTLTLQFANGQHVSYGKDWSKTITVTVVQ